MVKDTIPEFEKEFIDLYREMGKSKGWDDLTSRIIAIAYLSPEPIGMEELASRTGYSLASISTKMKFIQQMGFIHKRCRPGSKKCYFYMEKDFFKIMRDAFITAQNTGVELSLQVTSGILSKFKPKTEEEKMKLKIIHDYNVQLKKFSAVLKKFVEQLES